VAADDELTGFGPAADDELTEFGVAADDELTEFGPDRVVPWRLLALRQRLGTDLRGAGGGVPPPYFSQHEQLAVDDNSGR
jgi:hypothetical protein